MDTIISSETSVVTRTSRRQNPKGGIPHSHRLKNLKSYLMYVTFCLVVKFSFRLRVINYFGPFFNKLRIEHRESENSIKDKYIFYGALQ
jgi:hypothetical protein